APSNPTVPTIPTSNPPRAFASAQVNPSFNPVRQPSSYPSYQTVQTVALPARPAPPAASSGTARRTPLVSYPPGQPWGPATTTATIQSEAILPTAAHPRRPA